MGSYPGTGGRTVTVIRDLQIAAEDLVALGKQLKKQCGAGGTFKDGNIEIPGEHREKVAAKIQELGSKAKLAGG